MNRIPTNRSPAYICLLLLGVVSTLGGCRSESGPAATIQAGLPTLARTIPMPGVGGPVERNGIAGRLDHMDYDPATQRLFLAAFSQGSMEVIDLKDGKLIKTIEGYPEAQGIAVASKLHRVFLASGGKGTVTAFDIETLRKLGEVFVGEDADDMRYDPRTRRVLVAVGGNTSGAVVALDATTLAKVAELSVPAHAEGFQVDPDSDRVWINVPFGILAERDGIVVVGDLGEKAPVTTWKLHNAARNFPLALDLPHHRVFIATRKPQAVMVLDADSGDVLAKAPCIADCDDLYFDNKTKLLMASGGGRRVIDHAGEPVSADQPGALAVYTVTDDNHVALAKMFPLPRHTRTSLYVPQRHAIYLATPIQPGEDSKICEFVFPH